MIKERSNNFLLIFISTLLALTPVGGGLLFFYLLGHALQ